MNREAELRAQSRVACSDLLGAADIGKESFIPEIELESDQLGKLGSDVCHRCFRSAQAASRTKQGANFA